jgi:hypothetical protein
LVRKNAGKSGVFLLHLRRMQMYRLALSDHPIRHPAGCGSAVATEQVVRIQDRIGDFRIPIQAAAHCRRYRLPDFSAQPRALRKLDIDAAYGPNFARARRDLQRHAELFLHALRDVLQVGVCRNIFDAGDQLFLFFPCQPQYAKVGTRIVQQTVPITYAGARRALGTDWERGGLQHGFTEKYRVLIRFYSAKISYVVFSENTSCRVPNLMSPLRRRESHQCFADWCVKRLNFIVKASPQLMKLNAYPIQY